MSSKNERKKGLGRGLSSFLDVDSFEEIVERSNDENNVDIVTNSSNFLPIEQLFPNQNQPRKTFSSDELNSLASSIKETGIIQPILVRKINDFYEQGLIKISKPTLYNFDNFKTAFNSIKERKSIGKLSLTTSKFK